MKIIVTLILSLALMACATPEERKARREARELYYATYPQARILDQHQAQMVRMLQEQDRMLRQLRFDELSRQNRENTARLKAQGYLK